MTRMRRTLRTFIATLASLVAFAANSLLARAALAWSSIDATAFTAIRLASGALALAVVARLAGDRGAAAARGPGPAAGSWPSALALFGYALAFSWAYLSLSAGTGALILFGAVQVTMISVGLAVGERPRPGRWLGLVLALAGLVYLLVPGLTAPDPLGAALMALAGACWGAYSLRGRSDARALLATTGNFVRSLPLAVLVVLLAAIVGGLRASTLGVTLAVVSGVVTSGLGYVVWYVALGGLTATVAAVVQLAVPVLAALGGVALLGERLSLRLVVASLLILGGIAIASLAGDRSSRA